MPQAAIVALLKHRIGLDPGVIGPEIIARAVRHCMVQCGASDLQRSTLPSGSAQLPPPRDPGQPPAATHGRQRLPGSTAPGVAALELSGA
jgi:hypothetical protein